jgi:hypothetical protein
LSRRLAQPPDDDPAGLSLNEQGHGEMTWDMPEVCVVWNTALDMDQFQWVMDTTLSRVPAYFRVILDLEARRGSSCEEHTLVIVSDFRVLGQFYYNHRSRVGEPRRIRRLGVYLLADEGRRAKASQLRRPDYVLKEYGPLRHGAEGGGGKEIIPVPLGSTQDFGTVAAAASLRPVGARSRSCYFGGNKSQKQRRAMLGSERFHEACQAEVSKGFKQGAHPQEFRTRLLDSAVCPCPSGASIEQFRIWEALESGCLPIVVDDEPLTSILGPDSPLPRMPNTSWLDPTAAPLVDLITALTARPEAFEAKRREVWAWYRTFKHRLQARVAEAMIPGLPALTGEDSLGGWMGISGAPPTREVCVILFASPDFPSFRWVTDVLLGGLQRSFLSIFWSKDDTPSQRLAGCRVIVGVIDGSASNPGTITRLPPGPEQRWLLFHMSATSPPTLRDLATQAAAGVILADAESRSWLSEGRHRGLEPEPALLPLGPRSRYGVEVSLQQAMRPARTRSLLCATYATGRMKRGKSDVGEGAGAGGIAACAHHAIEHPSYLRLKLLDTVLVLFPPGDELWDSHLIWEALESGAVPVLSTGLGWAQQMEGDSPLPVFTEEEWRQGGVQAFIERLKGEPAEADILQKEVFGWYRAYRARLQQDVATSVGDTAALR